MSRAGTVRGTRPGLRVGALIAGSAVAVLAVAGVTAAVTSSDHEGAGAPSAAPDRPVTVEEAERLAIARFQNFEAGGIEFETAFDAPEGSVELRGTVDYRAHVGTASAVVSGTPLLLQWDADTVVMWPDAGDGTSTPTALPAEPGTTRTLEPSRSTLDTMLAVLSSLGADRPENAQLLRQSGVRWLAADDVDGTAVDVIAGPGSAADSDAIGNTRYWIDRDGRLRRFDATLPGQSVTIDMDASDRAPIDASPQLAADG